MGKANIANLQGSSFDAGDKSPQDVHVVDANGNPVTFGGSGGTSETDGASFDNNTTLGTPVMGAYQVTPDALADGTLGVVALDADRNLKVNVAAGGTSGTQYTEADTDASITGTALMLEGAANALVAAAAGAGTAAAAQRSTLASDDPAVVALQVIDDWDESDRAKVNTIAGQVGVQGGSGVVTALTQRVVLATDVALPTGPVTNAGTFAVQVDGDALTALQLIDNLVQAEDAVAGTGFAGVAMLAVRQDSHSDLAADGDFIAPTTDADGGLRVSIVAGAGSGGTAAADDADFTAGTTSGTPAMGVYESSPTSVTDGDLGTLGITATRALKVNLRDASGAEVSVGGGTQYTEADTDASITGNALMLEGAANALVAAAAGAGTAAAAQRATLASDDPAVVALQIIDDWDESDRAKTNPIVGQAGVAAGAGAVGATVQRVTLASDDPAVAALQILDNAISGSEMQVDVVAALPAGTNNIGDVDVLTIAAGDNNIGNVDIVTMPNVTLAAGTNTNEVVGDVAHDAAIGGNPVRIGARALTADYTAVAAGDTADLIATLLGKLVTIDFANPANTWSYAAASGGITNTTGVTAKTAAGAGIRNYITSVQVINGHATVSTDVQIRDGASGTVLWRGFAQAVGGGVSLSFNPPLRGTANTLVEVACGTTGSATYINLQGFVAAE